jgi:hypothetical protein
LVTSALADGHEPAERHRELRGDAPDALMEDRPTHRLVEKRGDDATVHEPVVAGVFPAAGERRLRASSRHVEVEVQPVWVRSAAGETPVIEIDAEFGQSCH